MGEVEELQEGDAAELRTWEKIMMDCFVERQLSEVDKRCWLVGGVRDDRVGRDTKGEDGTTAADQDEEGGGEEGGSQGERGGARRDGDWEGGGI